MFSLTLLIFLLSSNSDGITRSWMYIPFHCPVRLFHSSALMVLVCGTCQGFNVSHLCNVCNLQCIEMCQLLIMEKFKLVERVVLVLNHNQNFDDIVISLRGTVRSTFNSSDTPALTFQEYTMLDWHIDIKCTIKMLSKCGDDVDDIGLSDLVSWEELTETYTGAYIIDWNFTSALNTSKLSKDIQVLVHNHYLLEYLMEVETAGSPAPVLMSYNPLFYKTSQYVVVDMRT